MNELKDKLRTALAKRDYIAVSNIQRQIDALIKSKERITLSTLFDTITPNDKYKAVVIMNRIMCFSDILEGYAIDLNELLRKYDNSIDVEISQKAIQVRKLLTSITKNIDEIGDSGFSEMHGEICDQIKLVTDNIYFKYENR